MKNKKTFLPTQGNCLRCTGNKTILLIGLRSLYGTVVVWPHSDPCGRAIVLPRAINTTLTSQGYIGNQGTGISPFIWTYWPQWDLNENLWVILVIDGWGITCEIALRWMSLGITNTSTLLQVMARCRQATSHYLSQCWLKSKSPCGVIRPQWVKDTETEMWLSWHFYHGYNISCQHGNLHPTANDKNFIGKQPFHLSVTTKMHSAWHFYEQKNSMYSRMDRLNFFYQSEWVSD